jgi:hypothetical protein
VHQYSRLLPLLLTATVAVAACGSSDDSTGSNESSSNESGDELRDAEDVRSEELAEGASGSIGDVIDIDGVAVLVAGVVVSGDDDGPWLSADLRIENSSDSDIQFVNVGIVCAGNDETGGWQAGSTLDLNAGIPAGTFDEGTVNLLLPEDGRFGEEVPECAIPAVIRISPVPDPMTGFEKAAVVPLPDDVIAELNGS